jgi:holo-[acyl-carrier protein] synthase
MIIGFGNDLCDIRRIENSLARFSERFVQRCFTETERLKSDARAGRAASYAKRFAAKEACAKALGTGLRAGIAWRDMGVVNLPSGKPTLFLTGGAAARLAALTPPGHRVFIHVTLTDEYPLAQAQVIIEAIATDARVTSNSTKLSIIRDLYIHGVIANEILPTVTSIPHENNALAIVSSFFLRKATKTLDALCQLCEAGFAEDALVLGRTIFELGVHLGTIAAPGSVEQRQHRAECFIYDDERRRDKKVKEWKALKQQGKCLSWFSGIEAQGTVSEPAPMPSNFIQPRNLKDMATELGGEWECWYHFIYWSVSNLVHPRGLGSHTYVQDFFDQNVEVPCAIGPAVTMHYFLTGSVLSLLDLEELRPRLEECMQKVLPHIQD